MEKLLSIHLFVWPMFRASLLIFSLFLYIIKNVFQQLVEQVGVFSNEKEGQKITRFLFVD
ncbi:hypothetical protein CsSME_00046210 [Camellia sinensis var. sinensis]